MENIIHASFLTFTFHVRRSVHLLSVVTLILCSVSFVSAQGSLNASKKTAEQLIKDVKKNRAYLVDVRTPEEYAAGHLAYAQNIDFKSADFKTNISKLEKDKVVYLYCRSGNRSGKAVDTLATVGFKNAINIGGYEALKEAGLKSADGK